MIEFLKKNNLDQSEEIIFYGGTFNPWHKGHLECLKKAPTDNPSVVIIDNNPQKDLEKRQLDIETIKSEISSLGRSNIFIDTTQMNKKIPNPTSHWVKDLKDSKPGLRISLLMGFDSFSSIDTWIDVEELLNNLHCLYIVSRNDDSIVTDQQVKNLASIAPNLKLNFLGHHDYEHLSSTDLRKM